MTRKITLPKNTSMLKKPFLYGVATSSFQIEGAIDRRLPCIWDTFCNTPGKIADGSNGAIACEHVDRLEQDLDLIQQLGVDAYRFSISWPRVMDENNQLNPRGLAFYQSVISGLKKRNIQAFITLYHWDLPQYLEDKGGWLNRQTAYEFAHYANEVAKHLGDSVVSYATFNEPFCAAHLGYELGVHAPGLTGRLNGRTAAHHILLAHGLGVQAIRQHVTAAKVGIVLNFTPCYAVTNSAADLIATKNADEYINQWYAKPVLEGAYPDVLELLENNEKPPIEEGDMTIIHQPIDFLGVNFYTRLMYSSPNKNGELYHEHEHGFPRTDIGWEIYPQALADLLVDLHERYDLPPVYITENGAAIDDKIENGTVNDWRRTDYYEQHLIALAFAIKHGVNVQGYFAWSLMDNFEWAEGYLKRFGLVYVDYETQERTLKNSALAYKELLASRTE
ncbi:MAG: GH1 family beta-glucosidase [Glaciecola sp.]